MVALGLSDAANALLFFHAMDRTTVAIAVLSHYLAPVLVSQKTAGEWHGTSDNHRTNMGGVSDADYEKMFAYLAKNFGPDHKVPDLPPELLSGWTNY